MKKQQLLEIINEVGDNDEIAVPIIWIKTDAEQMFDVSLTDESWATIVETFSNGDYHDGETMEQIVNSVNGNKGE